MQLNDVEILLVADDACDAELTLRALSKRNIGNRTHHAHCGWPLSMRGKRTLNEHCS